MTYCHVSAQIDEHLAEQEENDRAWERLSDAVADEYSYEQLEEIAEAIRFKRRDKALSADDIEEAIVELRWQLED